ncbi:somatic embryogenesis receptor kinase 5 [Gossypium australe]|uniref:Somatic embryogenesis receptor kinase 5 n=2 Tax=Gossypium TaxID=3633 RepID=A0A5B6UF26_9ROSI|nr:somatic embryogenesis receptor kinase 5 [Gossypium australe]
MDFRLPLIFFLILFTTQCCFSANTELKALMEIKAGLDPENKYLSSWTFNGDPCDGSFEGLCCNEKGQIANISLQGKGLSGKLSPAIAELKHLTGLYLHYNALYGEIPKEIANLTLLTDLYLNMNNLSGQIPPQIGELGSLKVLQLCYNQLTGSIPTQVGSLKKLNVLALQSNQLTGAIPASLGDLGTLIRLDLSFNSFFGSIPMKLADAPLLQVLDIRNNSLSGNVPLALKRLNDGFLFQNNPGLCGSGFASLKVCNDSDHINPSKPEVYGSGATGVTREIPETANLQLPCEQKPCSKPSKSQRGLILVALIVVIVALSVIGLVTFMQYRRQKQKLSSLSEVPENRLSTDQTKGFSRKNGSPLISLEYANGWDPLADGRNYNGFAESFRFNLEEVETATQYFSELNLLGKSNFSATYRGFLRDGSAIAIKSISKTSCKSDDAEFLKGLNVLASLKHENLVGLRGFCCSKARGECFLIYDFVPNGNLLSYLDVKDGNGQVLEWSTRVSIVKGIAKGIAYLHGNEVNKPALVHQNISAQKVLIDDQFNPLLSDSGLHNLLTNDIVFAALKGSAAMGYLAPEYTSTGRFTEKSDVYAFGVVVFQVLCGKRNMTSLVRVGGECCRIQDFIDPNLHGRYLEYEAAKLARIAWHCTHECPVERPSMEAVVQDLGSLVRYSGMISSDFVYYRSRKKMGNTSCIFFACVDQASIGVVERWGRFEKLAEPGLHLFNPCAGQWLAGVLSTRISSLDVRIETKTKDNVFVQLVCSIQYRVMKRHADDAFYELQNPKEQIQAFVFDVVRALVPRMDLDELFEQKGEVAKAVLEEIEKVMGEYGYSIEHILMVDIIPDSSVRKAMNEINAAQRLQLASVYKGDAEKILQVKRAEAEAEAKYLGGVGVARQRQAITDGLRENILNFSHKVEGTSAKEVMDLIMITQYFDTIKDLGNSSKNTTVFIPHGPGHVRDIGEQIRNGLMEAASAKVNVE